MNPLTERGGFPLVWDSTMVAELGCHVKTNVAHLHHLKPKGTSIHLVFGGAFAKGMEVARISFFSGLCDEDGAIARGLFALLHHWLKHDMSLDPSEYSGKSLQNCIFAFIGYFENFGLGQDKLRPHLANGRPVVEFSFALPLDGLTHPVTGETLVYAGRFDMVGEMDGVLWGVDEKTTSQLGPTWSEKWHLRGQFTAYAWGAQAFGYPIAGMAVRGICVTKAGNISYMPAITYRPQWHIDRWLASTKAKIALFKAAWEENILTFAHNDLCQSYGSCPYQRLCTTQNPEPFIEPYYEVKPWNPLSRADD